MTTTKLTLLASAVLVGGIAAAGLRIAAFSAIGRAGNRATALSSKEDRSSRTAATSTRVRRESPQQERRKPSADEMKQMTLNASREAIDELLRDAELAVQTYWKDARNLDTCATAEQWLALGVKHRTALASFARALLNEAEINSASPGAADVLIWIVKNVPDCSMVEQAKEMIASDHIRSAEIEPLITSRLSVGNQTKATERLLREALARNLDRRIQGLACFYLARYLDFQATSIRAENLYDAAELEKVRPARFRNRRGPGDHFGADNSEALDREAAALYQRVADDFGDIPAIEPNSTTLDEPAAIHLKALRSFGVGKPAPEIDGVDLDGKPMKLSEYRGKVAVIYFGGPVLAGGDPANHAAAATDAAQQVAERHKNDPFALLGVSTINPGPSAGRKAYQAGLNARHLRARFWWDLEKRRAPGPNQTAWNVSGQMALHVIDAHGVIRYKNIWPPEHLEKAVTALLSEMAPDDAHMKNTN
jgi:hypothetical protein